MLYSNISINVEDKMIGNTPFHRIALGEKGRGRELMVIACNKDVTAITQGVNKGITVELTPNGRPRIINSPDPTVYALIDTHGSYTRRGNGVVYSLNGTPRPKILALGNGADGDAGRIGQWFTYLLKLEEGTLLRIRYGGRIDYHEPTIVWVHDGQVIASSQLTFRELCDAMELTAPMFGGIGTVSIYEEQWTVIQKWE